MGRRRWLSALALALLAGACRQALGIETLSGEDLATASGTTTASTGGAGGGGGSCVPCDEPAPPEQGACAPGCMEDGACVGRVLPAFELCETPAIDESCDGRPACSGEVVHGQAFHGLGEQAFVLLATDQAGDAFAAGPIENTLEWGRATLTATYMDVFVGKIAGGDGAPQWVKQLGDDDEQTLAGLVVIDGDPVIAGYFLGAFPGTDLATGPTIESGYVIRLDGSTGDVVWAKQLSASIRATVTALAATPEGDVVLCGGFRGALPLGGAAGTLPAPADLDLFAVGLDGSDGSATWGKSYPSTGSPICTAVAAEAPGTAWIAGTFNGGELVLGSTTLQSTNFYRDGFVARLDAQGVPAWAAAAEGADTFISSLALDPVTGRGYVLGDFGGLISFAGEDVWSVADSYDLFVAAFDADGTPAWLEAFGDASRQLSSSMARDAGGNLLVTGFLDGTLAFGGGATSQASGGEDPDGLTQVEDAFVAKLGPDGAGLWARTFGSPSAHEAGTSIAVGPLGDVFLGGRFEGQLELDGPSLVCGTGCVSDLFVTRLAP